MRALLVLLAGLLLSYEFSDLLWVEIDGEDYGIGAVYPSDEWTPADLVASYLDNSAPWVYVWSSGNCLWSSDYEHKFTISHHHNNSAGHGDYWLYIDGCRTWPVKRPVGDISPDNMLRLYQAGEWDGGTRIYSEECPGLVIEGIDRAGRFVYCYDVKDMTEADAAAAEEMLNSWEHVYLKSYDREQTGCNVFIYPDAPEPYNLKFVDTYRSSEGTYFSYLDCDYSKVWSICTGARVELYKQGELVQSWDLTPEKEYWGNRQSELIYRDGECYFMHYDTFWHLLPDGKIELLMDDAVGGDYFWDSTILAVYNRSGDVVFIPPLSDEDIERLAKYDPNFKEYIENLNQE